MPSLTKSSVASIVIAVAWVFAYQAEPFNLRNLVQESDVIAVVDISRIDDAGSILTNVGGREISANAYKANMRAERRIKGDCPDLLVLDFLTPHQFVGYPGVGLGRQLVFLKSRNNSYEFADPHYPSLPAAPGSEIEAGPDPLRSVITELGHVVSSSQAPLAHKWTVLARSRGIPSDESFDLLLRAGLNATDNLDLRRRIEAELVSRGDPTALNSSINLLLGDSLTGEQRQRFLLVIANDIKSPKSTTTIVRLSQSADPLSRRAAAEALWHTASPDAVHALVRLLRDSDLEVRFYAVRALSDIANEPDWGGPGESEFQEHQEKYLTHWEQWAKSQTR